MCFMLKEALFQDKPEEKHYIISGQIPKSVCNPVKIKRKFKF